MASPITLSVTQISAELLDGQNFIPLDHQNNSEFPAPAVEPIPVTPPSASRTENLREGLARTVHPGRHAAWQASLHRPRPELPPPFRMDGETEDEARVRKKYTLMMKFNAAGDVWAVKTDWPDMYERLTGGIPLVGQEVENSDSMSPLEAAQTAWGWQTYNLLKNGVPFRAARATIFYKAAKAKGFADVKSYFEAVVAPYLIDLGVQTCYANAAPPPPKFKLKAQMLPDGRFAVSGDTWEASNTLLDFKQFGLQWKKPFWVPKLNGPYDSQRLMAAMEAHDQIILTNELPATDSA
jgi:hypothetical protein